MWKEHFSREGAKVVELTAKGRVVANALDLNLATLLAIRAEEEMLGRYLPSEPVA